MSVGNDKQPLKFEILGNKIVHDGFFRVEQVKVTFDKFDGTRTGEQTLEVVQRGDSVAALLFDPDRRVVILVDQFRLPTSRPFRSDVALQSGPRDLAGVYDDGWLLETVAGSLRASLTNPTVIESPEDCLRREILDEVGYFVAELQLVARFYPSPGGSNEQIRLYFAEVANWQKQTEGGGDKKSEFIRPVEMELDEFLLRHVRQEFLDAKLILAGYWLRDYLERKERGKLVKRAPKPPRIHRLTGSKNGQAIAIVAGDVTDIEGVDVWVNPENTTMRMDNEFDKSVSASIRWKGSKRIVGPSNVEYIKDDTIANSLLKKLDGRSYVAIGEVIATGPGELREKGVRAILHVAVANGFYQQGFVTDLPTLRRCVENVLDGIEQHNRSHFLKPHRSVVFPLLGTGNNGMASNRVAPEILDAAIEHLRSRPNSALKTIYINGYSSGDLVAIESAVHDHITRGELEAAPIPSSGAES